MIIVRLRCLYLEVHETINSLNPAVKTDIFKLSDLKKPTQKNLLNHNVIRPNQIRYGETSLRVNLPTHIKSATNLLPLNV